MRTAFFLILLGSAMLLLSFTPNKACEYMGSNIGFIQKQTQKALESDDINISRYYAYRALNAIEKSKKQFMACGCEQAEKNIEESSEHLKRATRVTSLASTRIILNKALQSTQNSLEALEEHEELHDSRYGSDQLSMNTKAAYLEQQKGRMPVGEALQKKIDQALIDYQNSLEKVVNSTPCKEAYKLAMTNYERCEEQLLRPDLSEAKKYYNLRTKQITEAALNKLQNCATSGE